MLIFASPGKILSAAKAVGFPHTPDPRPSEIQDWPESPSEVIPYSILLAERIPSSTRSVRLESSC